MTPTNVILNRLSALLAADTTTLAPAALAVHIHLALNAFTPAVTLGIADFVEATFDGYAVLDAAVGPQQDFVDGLSGKRTVQLIEPLGGWHWETTGLTFLPQDVFGWYVTNNADTIVYGSARFDIPIALVAVGQGVDIAQVRFEFQPPVLA